MNAIELWGLSPDDFNEWRRNNDYPVILDLFEQKLPYFIDWMNDQGITRSLIFEHGIARFVSTEEPLLLCNYKSDGKNRLFEKALKKSEGITEEHEYHPYFYWLNKKHGRKIFEETKRDFIISSWIKGKPQFLKEHFLLDLGGGVEIHAPILSGRLLDFTCLDDIKIIGAISNTYIYLWHCSARGVEICGGLAFINFYRTELWDRGFGSAKKELILSDGIFQDFHFKDCNLRFHASRSTLMLCSVSGTNFDATLEHTKMEKTVFDAGLTVNDNYEIKREFYSKIKILFSSIGKSAEAGNYFFKEQYNEMLSLLFPKRTYRGLWHQKNLIEKCVFFAKCYFKFVAKFLNYAIWGFGEKPFRSLIASWFVILSSSLLFYLDSCSQTYNDGLKSVYFSIVTFVTLGYGDISQQNPILRLFSSFEAFSGMVLMGLFLAGYASKSKQY
ncbi:MAG: potassium channel family protein [Methylococcales bacterium]|nr:potassium channel family protein [Methylococcales bacterium]